LKFIFEYWNSFYKYVGRKLYLLMILSPIIGILESVGLALLLPVVTVLFVPDAANKGMVVKIFRYMEMLSLPQTMGWLLGILIFLFFLKSIFKGIYLYLSSYYNALFIKRLKILVVEGMKQMDYRYYLSINTGKIINNASNEIYKYATAMKSYTESISSLFILISYMGILLFISFKITLMILLIGGCFSLFYSKLNQRAKNYSVLMVNTNIGFKNIIIETVSFFKYLKATEKLEYASYKLNANVKEFFGLFFRTNLTNGMPAVIQEPISIVMILLLAGSNMYFLHEPAAKLVIILAISYRASSHISIYQAKKQTFYSNAGSIAAVQELMEELKLAKEEVGSIPGLQFNERLVLKNLSFSYTGEKKVLDSVNIEIHKNKTVAFVGPSGSGKSTLIDMLTGILKPDSGEFYIDEIQVNNLSHKEWRTGVGYITQENIVFNTSLKENIGLKTNFDLLEIKKVESALSSAHALDFASKLSEGIDTVLGERGVRLSGGQRQRVSIAREIYKNPVLLIMDEATSALDATSEQIVQESINELNGKTTIVIIAHRLATVKNADIIYVLNEGKIVESGSFDQLVKLNGYFSEQVKLQGIS
jgi:ABC-type multidrug transport system fused ATPase/permease subunit